jgi:hypothetical protein
MPAVTDRGLPLANSSLSAVDFLLHCDLCRGIVPATVREGRRRR